MKTNIQRVIAEDFWIEQLQKLEPHKFALKGKSQLVNSSYSQSFSFPEKIQNRLQELTKSIPTNTYILIGAAISLLLCTYTGSQETLIVTPQILNSQAQKSNDSVIFLRIGIQSDQTIRRLLQSLQNIVNKAYKHQDYNLDNLLKRFTHNSGIEADALFQVGFSFSALNQTISLKDQVTLLFHIENSPGEYHLLITHKNEIFSENVISQMATHFFRILEFVLWQPDTTYAEVKFLSEAELKTLFYELNATQAWYPKNKQVIDWFEEQVEQHPDSIAIVCEQTKLNYRGLNQRANQVAHYLKTCGIEPERRVGLLLTRSEFLIIAILGILKAGGTYLPIDPEFPVDRIQYMVADSGCQIILSEAKQQHIWASLGTIDIVDLREIQTGSIVNPIRASHLKQLAYLMYTSGSTGLPKGVAIEQGSLMNYLYWASKYYFAENPQLGNMALFSSPAFDLTVTSTFLPLLRGKTLFIYPDTSPEVVLETCFRADTPIDTIKLTPSHIQILNYIPTTPSNIELVIVGGEELRSHQVQLLKERNPHIRVYNEYGPTETTVGCTVTEVDIEKITVGKPIANTQIYILNESLQLLPAGVVGEICIGGDGLARGYWNREQLTAERFVTINFGEQRRVYRTGDLGRWLPGGVLDCLGRKDSQVKIRGYRIELPEIENCLLTYSCINDAAVIIRESQENEQELVAYIVGTVDLDVADVQAYLAQKLPAYMIPQHIICLERLPLTPNGKLNRQALPKPEDLEPSSLRVYEAPQSQLEVLLVEICQEVLACQTLGIHDNFMALGANSLKIIQIVARIRQRLGIDINWQEVFAHLTVRELANVVQTKQLIQLPPIEKVPLAEYYALSQAQRQFWLSGQTGGEGAYNVPGAVMIEGILDKPALEKAFRSIVARHEILRTTFITVDGEPRQGVNQELNFSLEKHNLTEETAPQETAWLMLEKEVARPFDLEKGPLLRGKLLQLSHRQHLLIINIHHIIFDGWSIGILLRELTILYEAYERGQESPLPPLEFQYKDYAAWHNAFLNSEQALIHQMYWYQKLQNVVPLDLPTDNPRLAMQTFQGAILPIQLDAHWLQQLEEFSQQHNVSQFVIVLTIIKALLHCYTGQKDIIVGTPVSERTQVEWENQIGPYLNLIVLRDLIDGHDRFIDLIHRIRQTALEAFAHQSYPFYQLAQELKNSRQLGRNPLFDVGYVWMDEIGSQLEKMTFSHLKMTQIPLEREQRNAITDLWFYFEKRTNCIQGFLSYNSSLFREETVNVLKQAFITILKHTLENPDIELRAIDFLAEKDINKTQVNIDLDI